VARKIIGAAFLSLDGVVQAPGGPSEDPTGGFAHGGWLFDLADEAIGDTIDSLFGGDFALLLGRRTYDIFAAYWPFAPMDDPIAGAFATVDKYVLTRGDQPLEWQGSHKVPSPSHLAAIKAQDGPDLIIQGSSTIYPALLDLGLIDELVLMIAPVLLGHGKRLFGPGHYAGAWRTVEQTVGSKGCIAARYVPAGPITHGTFGDQEPSAAEQVRQKRMAEGSW
jgi:dihydrofolate reductase